MGTNQTIIRIRAIKTGSPDELSTHVLECAKKNNLIVYKINKYPKIVGKLNKVEFFTSENLGLKLISGRDLTIEDPSNSFISSHKSDNANQVGVFSSFNLDSIINIYKLEELKERFDYLSCFYINTKDEKIISQFKEDLESKLGIESFIGTYYNSIISDFLSTHIFNILCAIGLLIVLYTIFLRYKEFAIKKLFGKTKHEIRMNILKTLIVNHIIGFFISGLASAIYLFNKVDKIALVDFLNIGD